MESLTEPVRKSVLDVIQYNLRAAGYKTYVTRVVYFGEYRGTHEVLRKRMENIIRDLRVDYNSMPITGLFLVYPKYYIHVLEAWEDIIYKHYELMYAADDDECKFGKAIPLPSYHHVHQVGGLICGARVSAYIYKKKRDIAHTYIALAEILPGVVPRLHDTADFNRDVRRSYVGRNSKPIDAQDVLRNLGDKAARYLPESTVLEFLLSVNAPVLKTVGEYLRMYSDASPSAFWDDNNVWPPPCDIMPRDVFDGHREVSNHPNSEK